MTFNYRYYRGESECPAELAKDQTAAVFWAEERSHASLSEMGRAHFVEMLKQAIASGEVSGALADERISIEDRSVEFYAELHYAKTSPLAFDCVDWPSYFTAPRPSPDTRSR